MNDNTWPRRLPRELCVPETPLGFNLEVAARRWPEKPAYLFFGRAVSWRELHGQAESLAAWLHGQGVQAGDRVILFLQNCPQFVVAFYAVLRAGAVVVPVNPMNRAEELRHCVTDSGACVVVTSADLADTVQAAASSGPRVPPLRAVLVAQMSDMLPSVFEAGLEPPPAWHATLLAPAPLPGGCTRWADALQAGGARRATLPPPRTDPDELALLPYTSGTTGLPKGCMHTHRTLMPNVVGGALWSHAGAESVSLAVTPMFHITGLLYGVLAPAWLGSTVVLMPRWERELAAALIARHRVTHWTCIPTMIIDLFGSPHWRGFDLSSLRYVSGGGAAMPQAVAEQLQAAFGITFAEGYGLTETAAPTHANPPERAKLQCLGIPIFGVDSRIVDPATLAELPPGESGEIVTAGPMLFKGYWGHPQATQAAFVELPGVPGRRFFRTGDLGRRDEEGYFFITDRLKRMINASGFKVWPSEVELMLFRCPLVLEACVIGARDAYRGETVKALVVLRDEWRGKAEPVQVVEWARGHMAAYKVPRIVEFVDALPKSASGKVMWRLLQEQEHARAGG